ncbi:MAG TPA: ATP-binding protein [Candidatus Marinimicrobia bacterium]|nr:ATP-binding protein [Candidatus Neomarinimicrobiota bacterium]HRU93215.1 ATP-binding protein [Candidatus Neomarinimicrobiota bacterium]
MTVLGEAISNSWDADANNVWVYIDRKRDSLVVKDDGDGMNAEDFQNKFLKIGYSKRKEGSRSAKNRPYIGRKGIGKIALLSCARRISILTRRSPEDEYVGGVIDNSGLDDAIKNDLTPDLYRLGRVEGSLFQQYQEGHDHGTIIYFENITEGVRNSINQIRKVMALYFRFSLIDDSFRIHVDNQPITLDDLDDLATNTQFLWNINDFDDPYINQKLVPPTLNKQASITVQGLFKGFIASVKKPRDLKIFTTEEKVGIDLFVNGRLRERDLLRHIPTARIYENYLYGQIHFDELDDEIDRFTSNREGIVADDPKFRELLTILQKEVIPQIANQWDEWRIEHREEGDSENRRLSPRERKSRDLFNIVSEDYSFPAESTQKGKVDGWVDKLAEDAQFNFSSYAECFISENLLRKYILAKKITIDKDAKKIIKDCRDKESKNKKAGNINIQIRQTNDDLSYLDIASLAKNAEPEKGSTNNLTIDAKAYKPIRDALAHTALLTQDAKQKLTTVYHNIKERIRTLLSNL